MRRTGLVLSLLMLWVLACQRFDKGENLKENPALTIFTHISARLKAIDKTEAREDGYSRTLVSGEAIFLWKIPASETSFQAMIPILRNSNNRINQAFFLSKEKSPKISVTLEKVRYLFPEIRKNPSYPWHQFYMLTDGYHFHRLEKKAWQILKKEKKYLMPMVPDPILFSWQQAGSSEELLKILESGDCLLAVGSNSLQAPSQYLYRPGFDIECLDQKSSSAIHGSFSRAANQPNEKQLLLKQAKDMERNYLILEVNPSFQVRPL